MAVAAERSPEGAVVPVTDGCGGIPEEDLPRVSDTGRRGTHARTPPAQSVLAGDDGLRTAVRGGRGTGRLAHGVRPAAAGVVHREHARGPLQTRDRAGPGQPPGTSSVRKAGGLVEADSRRDVESPRSYGLQKYSVIGESWLCNVFASG
ncbi:hypothetical protein GCM10010251_57150 [Streptomyces aurantiogriseus]|uniref:Uncharacterized protein n=1 Tax=Streptomyces aurantiogriseus TaxID=66870 RepID=A0A918FF16_9ACTN|nr:hypothetical protein GCM10010251_57150 [Streptomyces aurantiogriseus]